MRALHGDIKKNTIEKELLSNVTSQQEWQEAKRLFDALKSIRMQENSGLAIPETRNKASLKNYVLRLLFASAMSPITSAIGNIVTQKNSLHYPGSALGSGGSSPGFDALLPIYGAGAATLADNAVNVSVHDALLTKSANPRRVVRSIDQTDSLYLPSMALATENIEKFLAYKGLIEKDRPKGSTIIINAVVDYVSDHDNGLKTVATHLMRYSGLFGAKKNEETSELNQHKTLNAWMSSLLFADGAETFLVNEFINIYQNESYGKVISTRHFATHLSQVIRLGLDMGGDTGTAAGLNEKSLRYIHENIFLPIMPTFFFNAVTDASMTYSTGSLEWGYLHIGLGFAMSAEIDSSLAPAKGLLSLGIFLDAMLREGLIDPALIKLFMLPAMLYHVKYSIDNNLPVSIDDVMESKKIKQVILEKYFLACDRFNAINDPVMYLSQALASYHTRTKLAEQLIITRCFLGIETAIPSVDVYKYFNNGLRCSDVIDGNSGADRQLPALDTVFAKQNADIADAFAIVDKMVILDALSGIAADDADFLTLAAVKKVRVGFAHRETPQTAWGYLALSQYAGLVIKDNVDVFAAKKNNAERIYALIKEKTGYRIKRVDENVASYFDLLKNNRPELATDKNIRLSLNKDGRKLLQVANQSLDVLAASLSQIHRDIMFRQLNAFGYEKATAEKIRDFFVSMIPLYDCISHARAEEESEAVISCSTDIAALVPLAGMALKLGARAALQLGIGSSVALGEMASGFAVGQSLRMAAGKGMITLSRLAVLPAARELNRAALSKLGLEFIRLFDPGLEITGRLSRVIVKQVVQGIGLTSRSLPAMENILTALRAAKTEQSVPHPDPVYVMARLPALPLDVPVVKLGGETFRGQDIYARINPENNDIFGRKYTLAADNTLLPVPMPLVKRLHNLRTQGLGGLGAKARGRQWPTEQDRFSTGIHESLLDVVLSPADSRGRPKPLGGAHDSAEVNLDRSWRMVYEAEKFKPKQFFIKTYGDRESEKVLFPELGISLHQDSLDAIEYERAFARLRDNEKIAVRTWTLIEDDIRSYSDGTPNLTWSNHKPLNVEINTTLREGNPLSPEEKTVHDGLLAFLQADIPKQHGSYLRIAEYRQNHHIPWHHDITVGDIVTNYPQFMSVSADALFARLFAEQVAEDGPVIEKGLEALVIYRIDNAKKCTPLLPLAASTVIHEVEYLYSPQTYFRVKGISITNGLSPSIFPQMRIGVILEEIAEIPFQSKNLFSGATHLSRRPSSVSRQFSPAEGITAGRRL